jgi:transcriptional regulator with XRE-family HTH domain
MSKKSCNFAPHLWRMDVKINIINENIVQVFTMEDEHVCSFELPCEKGKLTYSYMATRIEHLFYDDIQSADVLNAISYVVKRCKGEEGFVPRLYFEETEERQNIGSLIRDVRMKRGVSSKDVAMLVGLAAPNYSRIESGLTSPTYKTLMRIFDVLDIHMDVQPADLAPVNVEERAEEERNAAWEIEQKRIIAQVRKEHPKMLLWSAKRVKESSYYQQLVREYKGN